MPEALAEAGARERPEGAATVAERRGQAELPDGLVQDEHEEERKAREDGLVP